MIEVFEQQIGRPLTHEYRHFLAGEPVHCGDLLERFENGEWVLGRYEWTTSLDDLPTFQAVERVVRLTSNCLLRWPK
jgi:hypothetical protein